MAPLISLLQPVGEVKLRPGGRLDDDHRPGGDPAMRPERFQAWKRDIASIGGVEHDKAGRLRCRTLQPSRVGLDHHGSLDAAQYPDILPQDRAGRSGILEEYRPRRAARQRFQPQGPGASEGIDDKSVAIGPAEASAVKHPEERFTYPIRGWPDIAPLQRREPSAAPASGDDPHDDLPLDRARRRRRHGVPAAAVSEPSP